MAAKKKTAASKRKAAAATATATATAGASPNVESEREERPFMTRVLTIGVASYLAHKVWTKRKMLTEAWYTDQQSETEQSMITAFEYLSSMGVIFIVGILVGVIFSKISAWVKRSNGASNGSD